MQGVRIGWNQYVKDAGDQRQDGARMYSNRGDGVRT